jgi:hypothetical protein
MFFFLKIFVVSGPQLYTTAILCLMATSKLAFKDLEGGQQKTLLGGELLITLL